MPITGGKNGRGAMRSAAWVLRVGFVIALVAAVWLTRPIPTPPGNPIANGDSPSSGPGVSNPRSDIAPPQNLDPSPAPSDDDRDNETRPSADLETAGEALGESPDEKSDEAENESPFDPEVRRTLDLIAAGGPYPYRQDDTVFVNREGRLPKQSLGYYREFTVRTPGEDDRGPRRIVRGRRGELFYTEDHYRSFVRIDNQPGSEPPRRDRQPSRGPNASRSERSR